MPHRVGRTPTGRPLTPDPNDPLELDRALREQEAFFATIVDDVPALISRWLPDGTLTFVNRAVCEFFQAEREQLAGRSFFPWLPAEEAERLRRHVAGLTPEQPVATVENSLQAADGTWRWTRWTNRGLFDETGKLTEIQSIGEDITEQRRTEQEAHGVLRARRALGAVNQAVTRARTEEELLEAACAAIVAETGYEMAWVGFPGEDSEGEVRIRAHGGDDHGYLQELVVSTRTDRPEGQGPTGMAFRSGEPVTTHDLQGDPQTAPWHNLAARAGMHAAAAIPLVNGGGAFGVVSIYSSSPGIFSSEELDLLRELADELALGILSLRSTAETRAARMERDRLAAILEASPDFIGIADAEGNVLHHNEGARRILGVPPGQPVTRWHVQKSHTKWSARRVLEEGFPTARAKGVWHGEVAFLDTGGREIPFSQTILAHYDNAGEVAYYSTIARDISEQKQAQDQLRHQFFTAVEVFGNLLELRSEHIAGHCRRVVEHAVSMAHLLGCDATEVDDIYLAALLHEIGKLGIPETMLNKPYALLTSAERKRLKHHPVLGEAALMALEPLDRAARLIRHHHEHVNGSGFPDGLAGEAIPRGARILAVANEFDNLRNGRTYMKPLSQAKALDHLRTRADTLYDAEAVEALAQVLGNEPAAPAKEAPPTAASRSDAGVRWERSNQARQPAPFGAPAANPKQAGRAGSRQEPPEPAAGFQEANTATAGKDRERLPTQTLKGRQLEPGMVLADDLITEEGMLLLSRERTLDERAIKKIKRLEQRFGKPMRVTVYTAFEETGSS
jgi:PAS domain S-box-containing protein